MNKHILTLLAILGWLGILQSQDTPLFQTTFYFTDAVGNKDSCTIGFDPMATEDEDRNFGEMSLVGPFDSILEVRASFKASLWTLESNNLSKILINPGEYSPLHPPPFNTCFVGGQTVFLIKAKHPQHPPRHFVLRIPAV